MARPISAGQLSQLSLVVPTSPTSPVSEDSINYFHDRPVSEKSSQHGSIWAKWVTPLLYDMCRYQKPIKKPLKTLGNLSKNGNGHVTGFFDVF